MPAGLYLGHGVMPLPQRLLAKILNLEFVEMQDLLPEAWLSLADHQVLFDIGDGRQEEAPSRY